MRYEPSKLSRRFAAGAAFYTLLSYAAIFTITPACIVKIGAEYQVNSAQLGRLYTILMVGFFISLLVGGRFADRIGKFPVMALGSFLMALGSFFFARAANFHAIIIATGVMGAGGGLAEGFSTAAISDLYHENRRTSMLNWSQALFGVGAITAPAIVAWILSNGIDWQIAYYITSILCFIGFLLGIHAVRIHNSMPSKAVIDKTKWRTLVKDPMLLWLSVGIMLYVGSESSLSGWLAVFFRNDLGSSLHLASLSVSILWAGITVGRFTVGWISNRVRDIAIIRTSLALSAALNIVLLIQQEPILALIAVFIAGICMAPCWPTIVSCAGSLSVTRSGTTISIVIAAGSLGCAIFPPMVGKMADAFGMRLALISCAVLAIINLGLFSKYHVR